ncbi:MAG: alpha/beta hydrolase [Sphingobacteriia bacterium]|nr:alpha/beta hydrolase [Sphingobacteriia bacterium]
MIRFIEQYRIAQIKEDSENNLNIVFLPGGPGMGSEYLADFACKLTIPGNLFIADFPGDGSNRNTNKIEYEEWKKGIIKIAEDLRPCVLVTHSFSGMFTLTIPELESKLTGLIIMNSAPDKSWMETLGKTAIEYKLPNINETYMQFYINPTDKNVENIFYASIPYLFLPHEEQQGRELLEVYSYNTQARLWGDTVFHPSYKYKWSPKELPTILIGSKDDRLLPIKLFDDYNDFNRENIQKVILEDAGHFPWLSKFDEINDVISDFIIHL